MSTVMSFTVKQLSAAALLEKEIRLFAAVIFQMMELKTANALTVMKKLLVLCLMILLLLTICAKTWLHAQLNNLKLISNSVKENLKLLKLLKMLKLLMNLCITQDGNQQKADLMIIMANICSPKESHLDKKNLKPATQMMKINALL